MSSASNSGTISDNNNTMVKAIAGEERDVMSNDVDAPTIELKEKILHKMVAMKEKTISEGYSDDGLERSNTHSPDNHRSTMQQQQQQQPADDTNDDGQAGGLFETQNNEENKSSNLMLQLLDEFTKIYKDKLERLENSALKMEDQKFLQEKVLLLESWLGELGEQNVVLVSTVGELEKEAASRVTLLQNSLCSMAVTTRDNCNHLAEHQNKISEVLEGKAAAEQEVLTLKKQLEIQRDAAQHLKTDNANLHADVETLLDVMTRARATGVWRCDDVTFLCITPEQVFGPVLPLSGVSTPSLRSCLFMNSPGSSLTQGGVYNALQYRSSGANSLSNGQGFCKVSSGGGEGMADDPNLTEDGNGCESGSFGDASGGNSSALRELRCLREARDRSNGLLVHRDKRIAQLQCEVTELQHQLQESRADAEEAARAMRLGRAAARTNHQSWHRVDSDGEKTESMHSSLTDAEAGALIGNCDLQVEQQLSVNIDVLASRLAEAESESERSRGEVSRLAQLCETLQQQLRDIKEARESEEKTVVKLRDKIKELESRLSELQHQLISVNNTNMETDTSPCNLGGRFSSVGAACAEQEVWDSKLHISRLENEVSEKGILLRELQGHLATARHECHLKDDTVQKVEKKLHSVRSELGDKEDRGEYLEQQLQSLQLQLARCHAQLQDLQHQLSSKGDVLQKLERENWALAGQLNAKTAGADTLKLTADHVAGELISRDREVMEQRLTIASLQDALVASKQSADVLRAQLNEDFVESIQELEFLRQENASLEDQLQQLNRYLLTCLQSRSLPHGFRSNNSLDSTPTSFGSKARAFVSSPSYRRNNVPYPNRSMQEVIIDEHASENDGDENEQVHGQDLYDDDHETGIFWKKIPDEKGTTQSSGCKPNKCIINNSPKEEQEDFCPTSNVREGLKSSSVPKVKGYHVRWQREAEDPDARGWLPVPRNGPKQVTRNVATQSDALKESSHSPMVAVNRQSLEELRQERGSAHEQVLNLIRECNTLEEQIQELMQENSQLVEASSVQKNELVESRRHTTAAQLALEQAKLRTTELAAGKQLEETSKTMSEQTKLQTEQLAANKKQSEITWKALEQAKLQQLQQASELAESRRSAAAASQRADQALEQATTQATELVESRRQLTASLQLSEQLTAENSHLKKEFHSKCETLEGLQQQQQQQLCKTKIAATICRVCEGVSMEDVNIEAPKASEYFLESTASSKAKNSTHARDRCDEEQKTILPGEFSGSEAAVTRTPYCPAAASDEENTRNSQQINDEDCQVHAKMRDQNTNTDVQQINDDDSRVHEKNRDRNANENLDNSKRTRSAGENIDKENKTKDIGTFTDDLKFNYASEIMLADEQEKILAKDTNYVDNKPACTFTIPEAQTRSSLQKSDGLYNVISQENDVENSSTRYGLILKEVERLDCTGKLGNAIRSTREDAPSAAAAPPAEAAMPSRSNGKSDQLSPCPPENKNSSPLLGLEFETRNSPTLEEEAKWAEKLTAIKGECERLLSEGEILRDCNVGLKKQVSSLKSALQRLEAECQRATDRAAEANRDKEALAVGVSEVVSRLRTWALEVSGQMAVWTTTTQEHPRKHLLLLNTEKRMLAERNTALRQANSELRRLLRRCSGGRSALQDGENLQQPTPDTNRLGLLQGSDGDSPNGFADSVHKSTVLQGLFYVAEENKQKTEHLMNMCDDNDDSTIAIPECEKQNNLADGKADTRIHDKECQEGNIIELCDCDVDLSYNIVESVDKMALNEVHHDVSGINVDKVQNTSDILPINSASQVAHNGDRTSGISSDVGLITSSANTNSGIETIIKGINEGNISSSDNFININGIAIEKDKVSSADCKFNSLENNSLSPVNCENCDHDNKNKSSHSHNSFLIQNDTSNNLSCTNEKKINSCPMNYDSIVHSFTNINNNTTNSSYNTNMNNKNIFNNNNINDSNGNKIKKCKNNSSSNRSNGWDSTAKVTDGLRTLSAAASLLQPEQSRSSKASVTSKRGGSRNRSGGDEETVTCDSKSFLHYKQELDKLTEIASSLLKSTRRILRASRLEVAPRLRCSLSLQDLRRSRASDEEFDDWYSGSSPGAAQGATRGLPPQTDWRRKRATSVGVLSPDEATMNGQLGNGYLAPLKPHHFQSDMNEIWWNSMEKRVPNILPDRALNKANRTLFSDQRADNLMGKSSEDLCENCRMRNREIFGIQFGRFSTERSNSYPRFNSLSPIRENKTRDRISALSKKRIQKSSSSGIARELQEIREIIQCNASIVTSIKGLTDPSTKKALNPEDTNETFNSCVGKERADVSFNIEMNDEQLKQRNSQHDYQEQHLKGEHYSEEYNSIKYIQQQHLEHHETHHYEEQHKDRDYLLEQKHHQYTQLRDQQQQQQTQQQSERLNGPENAAQYKQSGKSFLTTLL